MTRFIDEVCGVAAILTPIIIFIAFICIGINANDTSPINRSKLENVKAWRGKYDKVDKEIKDALYDGYIKGYEYKDIKRTLETCEVLGE